MLVLVAIHQSPTLSNMNDRKVGNYYKNNMKVVATTQ